MILLFGSVHCGAHSVLDICGRANCLLQVLNACINAMYSFSGSVGYQCAVYMRDDMMCFAAESPSTLFYFRFDNVFLDADSND